MRTTEEDQEPGIGSELIKRLLECADRLSTSPIVRDEVVFGLIATWWLRESHLAIERAAHAIDAGVPAETAWFLSVDDPGFQLAKACADEYYRT